MRTLKRDHLGIDESTDVLSFPIDGRDEVPDGVPRALGDVVLCPQVVGAEWRWPLTHGLLHLLGYEHGDEMEAREAGAARVSSRRTPGGASTRSTTRSRGSSTSLRTQRNMRIHFVVAFLVLVAALVVNVTKLELIALVISITFVLIAEMLNTGIEAAIDIATTSFDPMAKLAKDIAAGAVLIASVNAVMVGYLVFAGKVADRSATLLDRLREAPAELTLVALVLTIIIVIATKAYTGRGTPLRGGVPSGHAALAFAGWMAATYVADQRPPLPDLVDRVDHGAARRADARRVGRALGARGDVRCARGRARNPRRLPGVLMTELVLKAEEVAKRAYAPYSNYFVGAVVRTRRRARVRGRERRERGLPADASAPRRARWPPRRRQACGRARSPRSGSAPRRAAAAASGSPNGVSPEVSYRREDGSIGTMSAAELLPDTWNLPGMKSGFVAVAGRPNVGKSTLVNALAGTKVAIVSDKPHTTRNRIRGVHTTDDAQLVLVDLPGWQRPIDPLTERMQGTVDDDDVERRRRRDPARRQRARPDRSRRQVRRPQGLLARAAGRDRRQQDRPAEARPRRDADEGGGARSATSTRCTR